jgi:hypothetical protein
VSAKIRALRAFAVAGAALGVILVSCAGASAYPSRLQVVAKEFYYVLSRRSLEAGPAVIQLVDFGQDPHDLRVERVGGTHVYGTPIIQPGSIYNLDVTLTPGKYELWCSVANHRALGMEAMLVVTPRPG